MARSPQSDKVPESRAELKSTQLLLLPPESDAGRRDNNFALMAYFTSTVPNIRSA